MAEDDSQPPITEPLIVQDVFATGVDVDPVNGEFRLNAWVEVASERRIVARVVIPDKTARALVRDLKKALARGGH